jgi:DNA-directed RNA polymerase specialized sigma24 family protein
MRNYQLVILNCIVKHILRAYRLEILWCIITSALDKSSNDIYGVRGFIIQRIRQFELKQEVNYTTVLAEVYIRIYTHINKGHEITYVENYVRRVALNFLIETRRNNQKQWKCSQKLARTILEEDLSTENEDPDRGVFTKPRIVEEALKPLQKRQRTLVRLRLYANWNYSDIAEHFIQLKWETVNDHRTHNRLSKQYARILNQLRASLSRL